MSAQTNEGGARAVSSIGISPLSLLERIVGFLESKGAKSALIGAAALSRWGLARSTADFDLLTVDPRCLEQSFWSDLPAGRAVIEIRRGDLFDPLAGVARWSEEGERPIDLVVGRSKWQRELLERAEVVSLAAGRVPVALLPDLVLLKLYAGGPRDAWDIHFLLANSDRMDFIEAVEREIPNLPESSGMLWRRLLAEAEGSASP